MASTQPQYKHSMFRNYIPAQAKVYAGARPPYPQQFIQTVIDKHEATGGALETLVDIGCGPGLATRSLSPYFTNAYACDPSSGMISTASSIPSTTRSGKPVTYAISNAEELDVTLNGLGVEPSSVDLITAATCAHFFHMPAFYAAASRMLRPGGSLAIWTAGGMHVDRRTTPNASTTQQVFDEIWAGGNPLCRNLYKDLPLPWDCDNPSLTSEQSRLLEELPQSDYVRTTWNEDGELEHGQTKFMWQQTAKVDDLKKLMETMGLVARWRRENGERVRAGEVKDIVEVTAQKLSDALGGTDSFEVGISLVLLFFKKRIE